MTDFGKTQLRHIFGAMLLAMIAGVAAPQGAWAQQAGAQEAAAALEVPRAPTVTVVRATRSEVIGQVRITGTLVARDEVLIYPQVSGYTIDSLYFDIGDTVAKGDVLARINDRTLAAQLAQSKAEFARVKAQIGQAQSQISAANAALTQAETDLSRAQRLRNSGTATQATLDNATAAAKTARANLASAQDGLAVSQASKLQAKAALDIAQLNLDHATIKAPQAGLIVTRDAQVGAIASSAGAPIFRLIADGIIELEAEVIETALGGLSAGDEVTMTIANQGSLHGRVRLVSPRVDPATRLGTIKVAIDDQSHLRTGLFASGWVITDRHQGLTVPVTALLNDERGDYVLVVNDGVVVRRDVTAGLIWQGRREVLAGLNPDEVVMARAGAFFADGDRVNAVEPDAVQGAGQ